MEIIAMPHLTLYGQISSPWVSKRHLTRSIRHLMLPVLVITRAAGELCIGGSPKSHAIGQRFFRLLRWLLVQFHMDQSPRGSLFKLKPSFWRPYRRQDSKIWTLPHQVSSSSTCCQNGLTRWWCSVETRCGRFRWSIPHWTCSRSYRLCN